MSERRNTITKGKKGEDQAVINIKESAFASPGSDIPPLPSNMALSNIPTKAQQESSRLDPLHQQKSENSLRSDEDGASRGREINDTFMGRVIYLQWSFFALIIEFLFLYVLVLLHSSSGVTVPIGGKVFQQTVPVILELWMHICYLCTDFALSNGLTAYFGYQLSQKHGYSLIVCGFIQSGLFAKIQFSGLLNFRSKYKKVISRASMLWLVHILMLILTFFCSTAIKITTTRYDSGKLLCVTYGQQGVPIDRGWPTIETQAGAAEFIFGSSLGKLSSEEGTPDSTLVTYPQLIDTCQDGTVIEGTGFSTDIYTTCECSASNQAKDLIYAGIPQENATNMIAQLSTLGSGQGIVQMIQLNETGAEIYLYSIVAGFRTCGGNNYVNKSVLVCETLISNHQTALVGISWMNDGNPVRSAPNIVKRLNEVDGFTPEPASITWLYRAIGNAMGGEMHTLKLPGFYPGTVNPLLWWTTPNLQTMSVAAVRAGFETFVAMLVKVGITRTYSVQGEQCSQNLEDLSQTTLHMTENGFQIGLIFILFEIFLSIGSILACVPWFICKDPIIPAIRLVADITYFNIMLCKNSTGNLLRMIGSTADRTDIWPKLDMVVRVGENIQSVSDPDHGEIILDKPKLVTQLSWTKCY